VFSVTVVARRLHAGLLAVSFPLSLPPFGLVAANAQQSASPNLLPTLTISQPKKKLKKSSTAARRADVAAPGRLPTTGPVVVSPTDTVVPAGQTASSITVVTDKDIATQQDRTVPEVLNTVPGLNVVQSGGAGGQASVFMRGTNSNHAKVLIDGIDVGDPSAPNGAFDFAHLLVADIKQIEVLRGPQSGLYGSDAIGGVISIITRRGDGPPRATASIETGSFNTFNQTAGVSGSQDNFNYTLNVAHLHAGDISVTPLQLLPSGRKANGNNYDNMTYSTKLGADINENWSVTTVVRYTDATLLFTGDSGFPLTPNATQSTHAVQQLFNRDEAVCSLLEGRIKNYFGVNYANNHSYDMGPGEPMATVAAGERIKYDWHAVVELAPGNDLVVGAEQQTDRMDTTGFSAGNGNKAGFVELQTEFAKRLFLVANARDDFNDQFGQHGTYRIAAAAIVPGMESKLKAGYGTGFTAPTLSELFQNFPDFNFYGNPNLKPEESAGYDAGFEQPLFNDRVRFGSTYFHNSITNLITANATFTSYANVGLATTEGSESFVSADITERLSVRADYTFTRAVDAGTGIQFPRRPKEKWSVTATWLPTDTLTLSATVLHVSDWLDVSRDGMVSGIVAPGYTIMNLRGDYAISNQVKMFGRIDNLFDLHYQNPTGFMAPGFGVFGGIRVASYDVN
jgi:vitamin B12 transporter